MPIIVCNKYFLQVYKWLVTNQNRYLNLISLINKYRPDLTAVYNDLSNGVLHPELYLMTHI